MKKGWKRFWIGCGVAAGVGFICCIAAVMLGVTTQAIENRFPDGIVIGRMHVLSGFGHKEEVSPSEHHHSGSMAYGTATGSPDEIIAGNNTLTFSGITEIDAYVWSGAMEVKVSDDLADGEMVLSTKDVKEELGLRCWADGDEFHIETEEGSLKLLKGNAGTVELYLPLGYVFQGAELDVGTGAVYVDDIRAHDLTVSVGAGEAEIAQFTAQEAEFSCGAGRLRAAGAAEHKADLECGLGEIDYIAAGKQTDYNYSIECSGEVICGESVYSGLGMDETVSNQAAKEINIECGMGQVVVDFTE